MNCRNCDSTIPSSVLHLPDMPLAGGFLDGPQQFAEERRLAITLCACGTCGLLQIEETVDPDVLFRHYAFSTSTVGTLVTHFQNYARWLAEEIQPRAVLEFGCNDGPLLTALRDLGVRAVGVDAALNIVDVARAKGLDVLPGYFSPPLVDDILSRFGKVDIVTGSNCFAHNPNPAAILDAARTVLSERGVFIVEVMSAADLLDKMQWDTLYHEHLAVYSLTSLSWLLERHGWTVVDVFHVPMHAGSLRVVASPRLDARPSSRVGDMLAAEASLGLSQVATWVSFGRRVEQHIAMVGRVLSSVAGSGRIWAYGASGRATMWMNAANMSYIEKVVDASPLRAGKLMPGLHTPIVFPDEMVQDPPDYCLITAWNYADEIRAKEGWYRGTWVTPLPTLTFY